MTRMYGDYDAACRAHATAQGLDAPNECLKSAGFQTEVLQTGGFCMVLQAFKNEVVQVWVTAESDVPDTYLVCAYRTADPESGVYDGEEELACTYDVPLDELPQRVLEFSREEFNQHAS